MTKTNHERALFLGALEETIRLYEPDPIRRLDLYTCLMAGAVSMLVVPEDIGVAVDRMAADIKQVCSTEKVAAAIELAASRLNNGESA